LRRDDHDVGAVEHAQQRRDEHLAGLAAPVFDQQGGHRLAEARADAPLPADLAAGTAIDPRVCLAHLLEDLRQHGRVRLLGTFLRHQLRYSAVLPPIGTAGMPSLR
jgi:hypothetical protein